MKKALTPSSRFLNRSLWTLAIASSLTATLATPAQAVQFNATPIAANTLSVTAEVSTAVPLAEDAVLDELTRVSAQQIAEANSAGRGFSVKDVLQQVKQYVDSERKDRDSRLAAEAKKKAEAEAKKKAEEKAKKEKAEAEKKAKAEAEAKERAAREAEEKAARETEEKAAALERLTAKSSTATSSVKPEGKTVKGSASYKGGGSKTEWLKAAGIAESDWGYVDFIVKRESSWNPNAVNSSSGASGLVQALPCSKVPGDCFDPVDNLRWADGYAKARYGSWKQAHQFWTSNHWW